MLRDTQRLPQRLRRRTIPTVEQLQMTCHLQERRLYTYIPLQSST